MVEHAVTLVEFGKTVGLTDRQLRRLAKEGQPLTGHAGPMRVLPSKARAWLTARHAGRSRMRAAINREHEVRSADLSRRISETVRDYLPAAAIDAHWAALKAEAMTRLRAWPDMLAPRLAPIVAAAATGFQAALAADSEVRALLAQAAEPATVPRPPGAARAQRALKAFTEPLPADATPRERVITLRSRLAQIRQMIRRGELEAAQAVEFRWGNAVVRARQMALTRLPSAAAQLAIGRRVDEMRIRAALAVAVEDVLLELKAGDGRRPAAEVSA